MTSLMRSSLHLGSDLAGRYRLTRRIGSGGMGQVWQATDLVLDRSVAVKVLHDTEISNSGDVERFRAEARHAASFTHPGVALVYDYGEIHTDPPVGYLVMELVRGEPLSAWIAKRKTITTQQAVGVLTQAAEALAAAHDAGLVHRDVKPANMMITPAGTLKLTDFGIATPSGNPAAENGEVVGTALYMSPEQAVGAAPTPRSDVYSLAVVGYELLAGHPPFDGPPAAVALAHVRNAPPPLPTQIPAGLADVIHRALAKNPASRPADGHGFAAALRQLPDVTTAAGVISSIPPHTGAIDHTVALDATELQPTVRQREPDPTLRIDAAAPIPVGRRAIAARPPRRTLVGIVAAATVTALIVTLIVGLRPSADVQDAASIPETSASITTPLAPTITVTAATLIGRPLNVVRDTLQSEGLQVSVTPENEASTPSAIVFDVHPVGALPAGTIVVLTVKPASPSSVPMTNTAPARAPGNGNGKANGKDKNKG
jgi:eukaryotic-like serine/threonine-protein kinase